MVRMAHYELILRRAAAPHGCGRENQKQPALLLIVLLTALFLRILVGARGLEPPNLTDVNRAL
jgi:hypothetical protein